MPDTPAAMTPRYPQGTPEHAAYRAELAAELKAFTERTGEYADSTPLERWAATASPAEVRASHAQAGFGR